MPIYAYGCEAHGEFEVVRSVAKMSSPAHCPECGEEGEKSWNGYSFVVRTHVADHVLNRYTKEAANKPQVIERAGGGKAVLNPETGGYRPAVSHNAECPNEGGRRRNVAVLAKFGRFQYRLACECGYFWLYDSRHADDLVEGTHGYLDSTQSGSNYEHAVRIG